MLLNEADGQEPSEFELRFNLETELRAEDDQARRMTGYAALFRSPTKIRSWSGEFTEMIEVGAFADTLRANGDIRMLLEHDPRSLLARTSAGNLTLSEDVRGLRFEVKLPDTQLARDTYENVRAGNLKGMSFGFRPVKYRTERDAEGRLRSVTLEKVDLREVTITSMPAYTKTSVAIRSLFQRPDAPSAEDLSLRARFLRARG